MESIKEPLISIIIPTYKSASTVGRLLDTLLEQSYKNLEILLIDDCSPDNTLEVLRSYEKLDSRIKVYVLEKNSGTPSAGRNFGLDMAKGEYVTFCDHDDVLLSKDAIQQLWLDLIRRDVDSSYYSFVRLQAKSQRLEEGSQFTFGVRPSATLFESLRYLDYGILLWTRLYKLSLIREHSIRFPLGVVYEDCYFTYHYTLVAKKGVFYNRRPYYCWIQCPKADNLSGKKDFYSRDIFAFIEFLYACFDKYGYSHIGHKDLLRQTYQHIRAFLALDLKFFQETKVFFRRNWQRMLPLTGGKEIRFLMWLFRNSSLLSYLYFVLANDHFLRRSLVAYQTSFLGKALKNVLFAFASLALNVLKLLLVCLRYVKGFFSKSTNSLS